MPLFGAIFSGFSAHHFEECTLPRPTRRSRLKKMKPREPCLCSRQVRNTPLLFRTNILITHHRFLYL
ncbi:hypothetical protein C7382_11441 [Porphyromonas loveana]|uniref:Uncharacterized protein n=1 Tax=Porphyromonas loveana TaxID=1884669 RepID=A0A2U1F836_9PORP|nr:hypothetical protein C7382_11441 [Porphyromonas loveana]